MNQSALDKAMEKLEHQNIRLTPQRFAILEYLYTCHDHPTVEDVYTSLAAKYHNLSIATVYKNLRVFKKLGLVKELMIGEDSTRRYEAVTTEHYHVICTSCGVINDVQLLESPTLKAQIEQATGFVVSMYTVETQGICPQCFAIKQHLSVV